MAPAASAALDGVIVIDGDTTLRLIAWLVTAPGPGKYTVIETVPAAAAIPVARKDVDDTYVVTSGAPSSSTCASGLQFAPFKRISNGPVAIGFGVIPQIHGVWRVIVTVASPNLSGYAVLVARIFTTPGVGAIAGAWNSPVFETVPIVAFPPFIPFTDHTTVFGDNGTYEVNWRDVPISTLVVL